MRIETIHAFCQSLLRRFPLEKRQRITVEYVLRSLRFRRYGSAPHDRLMAWIAPPRAACWLLA